MNDNAVNVLIRVNEMLLDDNVTITQIREFVAGAAYAFGGEVDDE